jgi:hypothetical protein
LPTFNLRVRYLDVGRRGLLTCNAEAKGGCRKSGRTIDGFEFAAPARPDKTKSWPSTSADIFPTSTEECMAARGT